MAAYEVHGHVSKGFERVHIEFEQNFANGLEKCAQLCVYVGEEMVVDLWGSVKDSKPYDGDTVTNVFSSSKSLAAICIATLVNKGLLNYSDKVVKHWPEYASGDKEKESITVADILRHEGGMATFSKTLRLVDILRENIKKNSIGSIIEKNPLRFPPADSNTKSEYHDLTRGWILNEIFRRVDPGQRTIGECLRDDICKPLTAGCYIGMPFEELAKSFELYTASFGQVLRSSMTPKFLGSKSEIDVFDVIKMARMISKISEQKPMENMVIGDLSFFDNSVVKIGEIPSANGQCSARGLAKIGSMMANKGTVDGIEILSVDTWQSMHSGYKDTRMFPFLAEFSFSQGGVNRFKPASDILTGYQKVCLDNRAGYIGWMGLGGSVFQWYPEHKIGFSYVPTFIMWEDLLNGKASLFQKLVLDCLKEVGQ